MLLTLPVLPSHGAEMVKDTPEVMSVGMLNVTRPLATLALPPSQN